ncbi:uncharacterized protein LOC122366829 [Amphibalanus amphitrite]|uniref:uncharacterized protein LOC122366829 n=1 Tax=Amphibalanus amphitrite TaxID=1232801 RepID=UPI001C90DD7D|nr:uncharacterized protein LOC122366829 [Amphibalanus amphitrite]
MTWYLDGSHGYSDERYSPEPAYDHEWPWHEQPGDTMLAASAARSRRRSSVAIPPAAGGRRQSLFVTQQLEERRERRLRENRDQLDERDEPEEGEGAADAPSEGRPASATSAERVSPPDRPAERRVTLNVPDGDAPEPGMRRRRAVGIGDHKSCALVQSNMKTLRLGDLM